MGGVSGSYRNYENDYWALSYKEDIENLNKIAEPGSTIYVYGPHIVSDLARPDLQIVYSMDDYSTINYAIMMTKRNIDERIFPDSKEVFQVSRDNTVLSVVKKVSPGDIPGNNSDTYIP